MKVFDVENREYLDTDLMLWEVGPYHKALPGPFVLRLTLDGEVIVNTRYGLGYGHKGLEKALELHQWSSILPYMDRVDPEAAPFGEHVFCRAVEEICEIEVPRRAQGIRVLVSELSRIVSHMGFMVRVAEAVNGETAIHHILQDREKILDLFELLTGSRFSINFFRFGGVRSDVSDGFLERVNSICETVRMRVKEYNDLFSYNHVFLKRTVCTGVLEKEDVFHFGVTGPNARASGVNYDVRKDEPYSGYETLDFNSPIGSGEYGETGDAHDRFIIRLREIAESISIIHQVSESLSEGPFCNVEIPEKLAVPAGEAFAKVESPRGVLGVHVVSDGGLQPCRVQFRVPSLPHVSAIPVVLRGHRVEDLSVVLATLDLSLAEVDR